MSHQDTTRSRLSPEKIKMLSTVLEHGVDVKLQLHEHHARFT